MQSVRFNSQRPRVAFGPELADWGSWQWAGADIQRELARYFDTASFNAQQDPQGDVVLFIKHVPPVAVAARVARSAAWIYCPVDYYGSAQEIDSDAPTLRMCSRILVHCEWLRKYFEPYARVEYIDHHVKFVAPLGERYLGDREGYVLWVGVRSNLSPLVEWVNRHPLPCQLRILMNQENPRAPPNPAELGFHEASAVRVDEWNPERHVALTAGARGAIDIKGNDFRARHKPPAKAIDFIASGVPLAMNPEASSVEHLARMGFDVVSPLDIDRWFSREYWEETRRLGAALRELLSLERVGRRYKRIVEQVLSGG